MEQVTRSCAATSSCKFLDENLSNVEDGRVLRCLTDLNSSNALSQQEDNRFNACLLCLRLTASIPLCVTQLMALKLFSLEKEKSTY
jgi:hypothetical protein